MQKRKLNSLTSIWFKSLHTSFLESSSKQRMAINDCSSQSHTSLSKIDIKTPFTEEYEKETTTTGTTTTTATTSSRTSDQQKCPSPHQPPQHVAHSFTPPNRRPLEGGWGWACVLGCTLVHFFSPGLVKSFGVTIVYIIEKFQCSSSQVSAVSVLCGCCGSGLVRARSSALP